MVLASELRFIDDEGELRLVRRMAEWPRLVEAAATAHEPHRVAGQLGAKSSGTVVQFRSDRNADSA